MGEFVESDDFSDLYGDVELQLRSAVSTIQALSQLPVGEDGVYDNDDRNVGSFQDVEEGVGEEEDGNGSETEDDFDILLNDDGDYDNSNVNVNVNETGHVRDKFSSGGTGGKVGNDDDEYANVAENKRNFGVENGSGSYKLRYNYMGYNSTTFPSKLKSNGSARVASCLSAFVRDDWESNGCTYKFEKSCIGPQSRRNFSLPHSRTILDVNIDTLEHKPWRNSGVDITDFFNFGFDEDSWKSYCNHLEHGTEVDHDYQRKALLSLTNEISCRLPESEMLKGRAIQVEDGLGERQPSIDVKLPGHRDSDVVIEIPVRELEEDGVDDTGEILYSSISEDELPILEGPTQKSNPHRHTIKDDGDPPLLDSDSCERQEVQATKCESDGLAEEISSDEPEKSDGKGKPAITPKKKPESLHSQQNHCSSPFQNDYVGSRDGAYADPNKFHNHPKMVSQTSDSELWESSKDSTNCAVSRRSDYKYVARSRSLVQRNIRFQQRRSNLKLGVKNHLDDEFPLHMSDVEDFYDGHYRAVDFHKQRKRHHEFDSYRDKDYLYHEELDYLLTYQGARFSSKAGSAVAGYSRGKGKDCRDKSSRYTGGNVTGKQPFHEQRTQRLGDEGIQRKCNYRKRIHFQEMDSFNYDVSGQLITEDAPYLYNGDHTQSKRKFNEFYINEHNCDNKFTQEKYQPMPDNRRERDYLERRDERELPYTRGESKSTLMNTRRYGNPFHDHEDIWHPNSEDQRSRYSRNRLYFHSYREPQPVSRGQMKTASLSRNGMIGRHGRQRRQNCVESYGGRNKLDGYTGRYINSGENIRHTYGHDSYVVGRSKNWESEVLHWSDQENDRHQEDNMEAVEISYTFGRTSSYKKFDSRPGSDRGKKLIDGREPSKRRYELPIVGDRCSQFANNLRQAPTSCWDPADSHIFVGNGKSSSCSKAGNLMYSDRYDVLDWNDELECETMNGFNESHFRKVIQADSPRIDGFRNSANWPKKLSVTLHKNCLDFEEVPDDLNNKSRKKENVVHQSINAKELEKPRIMEILAKMEKRRERFQQPLTSKNVEDKNSKPVADSNGEATVQRPARKRKWGGN